MTNISIFHPCFTWHKVPNISQQRARLQISSKPPPVRWLYPQAIRLLIGRVHRMLLDLSEWYCNYYKIQFCGTVAQLPFGLVLKRSDGTRLEEVAAMQVARDAGLPIPKVISYGEHPETPHAPVSILMTRMPGEELFSELWDWYLPEEKQVFVDQLRDFLRTIRQWDGPRAISKSSTRANEQAIHSVLGTSIRSVRVPMPHYMGPFENEDQFDKFLQEPIWWKSESDINPQLLADVRTMEDLPRHHTKFTHGDLAAHNVLVMPDGRISAVIDWESGGWYPAYWEFTTAWGLGKPGTWWHKIVKDVGGANFEKERVADLARRKLTADAGSFGW